MSFLFEGLTREECEAIREQDGYDNGLQEGINRGLREGLAKGRSEGLREGEASGVTKGKLETAKKMKLEKLPSDLIARVTGLSEEEIVAL